MATSKKRDAKRRRVSRTPTRRCRSVSSNSSKPRQERLDRWVPTVRDRYRRSRSNSSEQSVSPPVLRSRYRVMNEESSTSSSSTSLTTSLSTSTSMSSASSNVPMTRQQSSQARKMREREMWHSISPTRRRRDRDVEPLQLRRRKSSSSSGSTSSASSAHDFPPVDHVAYHPAKKLRKLDCALDISEYFIDGYGWDADALLEDMILLKERLELRKTSPPRVPKPKTAPPPPKAGYAPRKQGTTAGPTPELRRSKWNPPMEIQLPPSVHKRKLSPDRKRTPSSKRLVLAPPPENIRDRSPNVNQSLPAWQRGFPPQPPSSLPTPPPLPPPDLVVPVHDFKTCPQRAPPRRPPLPQPPPIFRQERPQSVQQLQDQIYQQQLLQQYLPRHHILPMPQCPLQMPESNSPPPKGWAATPPVTSASSASPAPAKPASPDQLSGAPASGPPAEKSPLTSVAEVDDPFIHRAPLMSKAAMRKAPPVGGAPAKSPGAASSDPDGGVGTSLGAPGAASSEPDGGEGKSLGANAPRDTRRGPESAAKADPSPERDDEKREEERCSDTVKEERSSDTAKDERCSDTVKGAVSKARPPLVLKPRRDARSVSPESPRHAPLPRPSDDEDSGDEAVDATDITKLSAMGLVAKASSIAPESIISKDKWEMRLAFEDDGFVVDMQDMDLSEDNMAYWCMWLQKKVGRDALAKRIDLSRNNITSKCVGSLTTMLQGINARCVVLNLQSNMVCDEGVKMIAKFLTSYSEASVCELHLSDNRITKWGVMWLLVCLALHPGYPIRDKEGTYNPMWLLLDRNDMTTNDAEDILKTAKDGLAISLCDAIGCTISQCSKSYLGTRRKPNCVAHMINFFDQPTGPPLFFPLEVQHPDSHGHVIFYNFPTLENIQLCTKNRSQPEIVWEDDDNMVVMKPANWLCHSTNRTARNVDELLNQVTHASLHHYLELCYPNAPAIRRLDCQHGLCHRLDRETSGFVLCCKTKQGYTNIKDQIYKHELIKDYIALVHGQMEDQNGVCKARIDDSSYKHGAGAGPRRVWVTENQSQGVEAITLYETLRHYQGDDGKPYTLLHFRLVTGRTHQIRVHMSYLGHALVSDSIYNEPEVHKEDLQVCPRLFLHKLRAAFFNTEKVPQVLWAPLQMVPDLCNTLLNLKEINP